MTAEAPSVEQAVVIPGIRLRQPDVSVDGLLRQQAAMLYVFLGQLAVTVAVLLEQPADVEQSFFVGASLQQQV